MTTLTILWFDGDPRPAGTPVCMDTDFSDDDRGRDYGAIRKDVLVWCEENLTAVPTLDWRWEGPAWNEGYDVFDLEFANDIDLIFFKMRWS